jgi:chemotaxis family two-component system sensor kinase Cph1
MIEIMQSEKINLAGLDRESIELNNQIQPHGILLVLEESDYKIVQISNNVSTNPSC